MDDTKPLVHMTKNAIRQMRGSILDVFEIACGIRPLAAQFVVTDFDACCDPEVYKRVTCPICIIAMDSDE